ncbi:putative farnesyl-diphosphate farnesyltransferase [Kockovaella imperatae]|uniref:Squalene synthase n=1 Tax=Kockovaella imperatae TaxID=4999 RepID=A0A1Y1U9L6_9TREE|nr:putative farnesyl-diphosphate farnesyltransferase [Kockovaella imperatae]ORX34197.1 putative farnesyl-diphosphate farnesyltransferase [Kockovaella imperatae]
MPSAAAISQLLIHPTELRSVINYKLWRDKSRDITNPAEFETSGYDRETMRKCWDLLDFSSRSFSVVVKELEGDLARTVCIFYLVLRALDTFEDDMTIPNDIKLPNLRNLHRKLHEPGWHYVGSKDKDAIVLESFASIQKEFSLLDPKYQVVIEDICRKMGAGMADFAALATPEQPVAEIKTIEDYDLYCHYVAGLVGEGLSGLFSSSGKERPWLSSQLTLSNSCGLLLQKTNILRDVKEDVDDGRGFWPREIYAAHGFDSMKGLIDPAREKEALFAASHMTLDALRHCCDALDYMTLLKCQSVFNFVAIPAVMAIATLDRCFMNPKLLKQNVKIRRGEAVGLIMKAVNPRDVAYVFQQYARSIHQKVKSDDPNMLRLSIACAKIDQWTEHHYPTFLTITGSSGAAQTAIDPANGDARAVLFTKIITEAKEKKEREKREALMADLRARGIIKDRTPEQIAAAEKARIESMNESPPWLMIGSIIVGILAVMGGLGYGIIWFVMNYLDD